MGEDPKVTMLGNQPGCRLEGIRLPYIGSFFHIVARGQPGQPFQSSISTDELSDEPSGRGSHNVFRCVVLHQFPIFEDQNARGKADRLIDVVGDKDDCFLQIFLDPGEFGLERLPRDGIDGPERFVHQEDGRVSSKGSCHTHPLRFTSGKLAGVLVPVDTRVQIKQVKEFVSAPSDLRHIPIHELGNNPDVPCNCHMGE